METQAMKDVRATIEKFRDAVQTRDIKALESAVGQEPDMVFYGSQAGDKQVGWPASRPHSKSSFRKRARSSRRYWEAQSM